MKNTILKRDSDKSELIQRLSSSGLSLLFFYEEEPPEAIKYEILNNKLILITPPYEYEILEKWLYLGNWIAISPSVSNFRPIDTFRAPDGEVEEKMNKLGINILIDSFHDDIEWNVYEKT